MAQVTVRVKYPLSAGRVVLRTDHDWDADVEAVSAGGDGTVHEFRVDTDREYFYFKPCIVDPQGLHWSVGSNYLALAECPSVQENYPHFFSGASGSIADVVRVPSKILDGPRGARVYLPPGYAENTLKRYPVLYMHDGRNLFFPDEAFAGVEWRVDETLDLLDSMNLVDKVIVVGIRSSARRTADYTLPGYERYARFVVEELRPYVDVHFRTLDGPEWTAVMGSSLGGVVSLYLAWQYPQVFGQVACLSSKFAFKDDLMDRIAVEPKRPITVYLDSGWPGDNYEVTRAMSDLLVRRGYAPWHELLYLAFPEALHNEAHWGMRSHIPFQFFFGKASRSAGG